MNVSNSSTDIAIIAPNITVAGKCRAILKERGSQYTIVVKEYDGMELAAKQLVSQGARTIIAFGMFAKIVRQSVNIPVVMVDVTEEDIIEGILKASKIGKRVGIMGFRNIISTIFRIQDILTIELVSIPTVLPSQMLETLEQHTDIDVMVSGHYQAEIMASYGVPTVIFEPSEQAINHAITMAESYLAPKEGEDVSEDKALPESSIYAVMSVDRYGNISLLNKLAAEYLGVSDLTAVSFTLESACPQLTRVGDAIRTGRAYFNQIAILNGRSFLYHVEPILGGDLVEGVTVTLQDTNVVLGAEVSIRRSLTTKKNQSIYSFENIVAGSECMTRTLRMAMQYAQSDETVLVLGETGTGKELFAQGIHHASARKNGPFVAINCASLPENILESELFGYVRGAFTGATKEGKRGLFEVAHTGTIFLDEFGDISLSLQGKLLRVLQERTIRRLGDDKQIPIDIRVIAATNQDLIAMVRQGLFRADLYFRINVLCLSIPPLRQRGNDILLLADEFLREPSLKAKRKFQLSTKARQTMLHYYWPGNIRELQNLIRRVTTISDSDTISEQLVTEYMEENARLHPDEPSVQTRSYTLDEALLLSGNNKNKAAQLLGVSRATLYRMLERIRDQETLES